MRLQRMLLHLQWYDLEIVYKSGKDMQLPDTLSRAYQTHQLSGEEVNLEQVSTLDFISITKKRYVQLQEQTRQELQLLLDVIHTGWPSYWNEVPIPLRPYWNSKSELGVSDGIIYKDMRIVVPPSLCEHMLSIIHRSPLGIVKCKQRARKVLYWPTMNQQIEEAVKNCTTCADYQNKLPPEPLIPTQSPDLPFNQVAVDLFEFESKQYILVVDYYSKFIEVCEDMRSRTMIDALKSIISTHGIPEGLRSDNASLLVSRVQIILFWLRH